VDSYYFSVFQLPSNILHDVMQWREHIADF